MVYQTVGIGTGSKSADRTQASCISGKEKLGKPNGFYGGTVRHVGMILLQAAFLSIMAVYGFTIYQKPRPFYDVPFLERSQSQVDGEVRVTVAVLNAEESRQLFGVNLAGKGDI